MQRFLLRKTKRKKCLSTFAPATEPWLLPSRNPLFISFAVLWQSRWLDCTQMLVALGSGLLSIDLESVADYILLSQTSLPSEVSLSLLAMGFFSSLLPHLHFVLTVGTHTGVSITQMHTLPLSLCLYVHVYSPSCSSSFQIFPLCPSVCANIDYLMWWQWLL